MGLCLIGVVIYRVCAEQADKEQEWRHKTYEENEEDNTMKISN